MIQIFLHEKLFFDKYFLNFLICKKLYNYCQSYHQGIIVSINHKISTYVRDKINYNKKILNLNPITHKTLLKTRAQNM